MTTYQICMTRTGTMTHQTIAGHARTLCGAQVSRVQSMTHDEPQTVECERCNPTPKVKPTAERTITTEDHATVGIGDRVWCYYATPMQYGTIAAIEEGADPWADVEMEDGNRGYFNGTRLAIVNPSDERNPRHGDEPTRVSVNDLPTDFADWTDENVLAYSAWKAAERGDVPTSTDPDYLRGLIAKREAFTCGTCGRSWLIGTPAGRCPFEAEHADEDEGERIALSSKVDEPMDDVMRITSVTVTTHADEDGDASYLEPDSGRYDDEPDAELRATAMQSDADRLASYRDGDWYMVGIAVTAEITWPDAWSADGQTCIAVGGTEDVVASLWGIESDTDESYAREVAAELVDELRDTLKGDPRFAHLTFADDVVVWGI